MSTYLKYKPVWYRAVVLISLFLGALLIIQLLAALLIVKFTNIPLTEINLNSDSSEMLLVNKILMLLQGFLFFIAPALLYGYLSDPRPMRFLRLNVNPTIKYLIIAAVIMVVAIPSSFWLGELNKHLDMSHVLPSVDKWIKAQETETNKVIEAMLGRQSIKDLFVNLFLMALLPAIGEELVFRGLVQKGLIRITRNVWGGIIMASLIFSAIHFQFLTFLTRFELGIILGVLFWYSGSLWTSITAHFLFNGLQVVWAYYQPNVDKAPSWLVSAKAVGISFLLIVLLIIIIKRLSIVTMSEVYDDDEDDDFTLIESDKV